MTVELKPPQRSKREMSALDLDTLLTIVSISALVVTIIGLAIRDVIRARCERER